MSSGVFPVQGQIIWPGSCYWGAGALSRAMQAARSRLHRPLVVSDAGVWAALGPVVAEEFAALDWQVYDGVVSNPSLGQVREALRVAQAHGCQSVVAVGGGSVMDVAKLTLACLASGLEVDELTTSNGQAWLSEPASTLDPFFMAVPTTAGTGSESSTAALIQGEDGRKHLFRSTRARPSVVALQPDLTLSLPSRPTAHGGFDAVLHALGAWVNQDHSPVGKAMALHALRICMKALPAVLVAPGSLQARAEMQMGAYLAGVAIGMCKVDAVHALCTPLESRVHTAHAEVLGPVFSVVSRHTIEKAPAPYAEAARALGLPSAGDERSAALSLIDAVEELSVQAGIPIHFEDLHLTAEDAHLLALQAQRSASLPLHPCELGLDEIKSLYLQMAS
ncbi:MAG: iron-containing alcohol dehydrogenase [Comamonadaceae bacterium]|nr:iron-containing alcohol dehydrogenase [Comamonadaceae bacterium]